MMLSGLAQHANKLKYLLNDNSTTLLSVVGVGGSVATALLTGRATFKAARLIDHEQEVANAAWREGEWDTPPHEFSKTEKAKLVWHLYLPPIALGVLTVTCIIAAHRISTKQIVALTAAAGISERALTEYKDKVLRSGAKEDEKIHSDIAQDRVNKFPPSSQVMIAGSGDVLCYDMLTGRYFQSTMEELKRAENKVNYS